MTDLPSLTTTHSTGDEVPLTAEEMRPMVEELLPAWMKKLGCPHWEVSVVYGPCAHPEWSASCQREVEYEIAVITLDPAHHFTREDVERSLVHELLHVKLAIFDLYRNVVTQNRGDNTAAAREEAVLFTYCVERAVKELRRLVVGMGGIY